MPGRILTLQRQARELGRLRSGYTDTSGAKPRPVRSATWIVTSHDETYVKAAAELWGGKPEKWQPLGAGAAQWRVITEADAIDAIMPPGDPLSQANELWNKGGIARRCTGELEMLTDSPCLCLAQFGPDFHTQPKDKRCQPTSRLSLILPAMPDVGIFRVESHGWYAANEIAATVDVIRSATGGNSIVPVQIRIEPRTRVSEGQTKKFPVIVLALRGVTAGQILSGTSPGLAINSNGTVNLRTGEINGTEMKAISPAPSCDAFIQRAMDSRDAATVRKIWTDADAAGCLYAPVRIGETDTTLKSMLTTLGTKFAEMEAAKPSGSPAEKVALWTQCMAAAPNGWGTDQVLADWYGRHSCEPAEGSLEELSAFLVHLQNVGPEPEPEAPDVAPVPF